MDISKPIIWEGDLTDDCTARWNGLVLRAEWMDEEDWWWAVSINNDEIASSNDYDTPVKGGAAARERAEVCARLYIQALQSKLNK